MYAKRLGVATILAVLIFGAVYGIAAGLPVSGVEKIGAGSDSVLSPGTVKEVNFFLEGDGDPSDVDAIVVTFEEHLDTTNCKVYIKVDTYGWYTANWLEIVDTDTEAHFEGLSIPVSDIDSIDIVVECPG